MNRRRMIIIAITIIVTLVVIAVASLIQQITSERQLTLSRPFATGMRYAKQVDDNHLNYFDGSVFQQITISSQSARPLTPSMIFPNVTAVKWGKSAALFQASGYNSFDVLSPILDKYLLDQSGTYWWKIDFKSGNISLVGNNNPVMNAVVNDAAWTISGDSFYYVQESHDGDDGPSVEMFYSAAGFVDRSLGSTDAAKINWASTDKVIYTAISGDVISWNVKSGDKKTLFNKFNGYLVVNQAGTAALVIKNINGVNAGEGVQDVGGILQYVDLSSGKTTQVSSSFSGDMIWADNHNWTAIAAGQSTGDDFVGVDSSFKKLVLSRGENKALPTDIYAAGYIGGDRAVIIDADGTGYVAATKVPTFKKITIVNTADITITGDQALTDAGLSISDIESIRYAFARYVAVNNISATEVAISEFWQAPVSNTRTDSSTTFYFTAVIGGDKLSVNATYTGMYMSRFIFTKNNKKVFDSGIVTAQNRY